MAFFSGDPRKEVLKGVPPDKSVGAWPSVQEKTTGTGNVGKSPRGGTNVDDQSLKVHVIPPMKPIPSFSFGGQTKHDPRSSFGEQTKDIPPVKVKL